MTTQTKKPNRKAASLSGSSGEYFVAGELSRLGYISLPTVKNTKGVDIIVSTCDFKKTAYIQIKTNRDKYDFWIVGKPVVGDNIFYVFVNLLSNQKFQRPEFYVVPSNDVLKKSKIFEDAKNVQNLTKTQKEQVMEHIKKGESAWSIVANRGFSVTAIRNVAKENSLKIKYDRGKGENFPFCFYIRKENELKYRDKWNLLFDD